MRLPLTLQAWGRPDFEAVARRELAQYADRLPLGDCATPGAWTTDVTIEQITPLADLAEHLAARVLVSFREQFPADGCSLRQAAPCFASLRLTIDRRTAEVLWAAQGEPEANLNS